jgi:hypothetical protein
LYVRYAATPVAVLLSLGVRGKVRIDGVVPQPTLVAAAHVAAELVGDRQVGRRIRQVVLVGAGVHVQRQSKLPEVALALQLLGALPRAGHGRQDDRQQDGDDSHHHEQFDQREPAAGVAGRPRGGAANHGPIGAQILRHDVPHLSMQRSTGVAAFPRGGRHHTRRPVSVALSLGSTFAVMRATNEEAPRRSSWGFLLFSKP